MFKKYLCKTFIISLIKTISLGSIYTIQPYLDDIYINSFYIDKLNILLMYLLIIKLYISITNYIHIFKLLENIYSQTKYLFTIYNNLINYEYMDDDIDGSSNISINIDDLQNNKRIQINYIRDILILYLSIIFSYVFKLNKKLTYFMEHKQLYNYLESEIKQINIRHNSDELMISLIELLILKNFNNIKNLNYINSNDHELLIKVFKKLQNSISELYSLIGKYEIYYIIIIFTYIILFINIISIYIQYLNINIYSFLFSLLINFIIIFLDDIINVYLNLCFILSKIFDFETYLKELTDEFFITDYLYRVNKEYIL